MTSKRMEGKLIDIVANSWNKSMPSPEQIQLAITEGVRLAILEHLTGKPAPYLVDTNLPKWIQEDMHKRPSESPIGAPPAQNPAPAPRSAPAAAKAPAPAPPPPATPARAPAGRKMRVSMVSTSNNAQRYLNVKFDCGPLLRFYLNSATQAHEWGSLLYTFVSECCGIEVGPDGAWETKELVGKEVTLYGFGTDADGHPQVASGLFSVAEALGLERLVPA